MKEIEQAKRHLVIANRVLAMEEILDAYGHVSIRNPENPERFFLARSLSPELVGVEDLIEFTLDGKAVNDDRPPYLERFIHGRIYAARPDVSVVVHAHTEATLPFSISDVPLRPVIHNAYHIGKTVPVWDIAKKFGSNTDLMVTNNDHGNDLAEVMGKNNMVLMRGHGFSAASTSPVLLVTMCINLRRNARVLLEALRLGAPFKELAPGEIEGRLERADPSAPSVRRGWELWATKAGCADYL